MADFKMGMSVDTIIFDMGDVLVKGGHRLLFPTYGLTYGDKEHAVWQDYKIGKCTEQEYWQRTLSGTKFQGHEEEFTRIFREAHAKSNPTPAYELLKRLRHNGYRVPVLSNHGSEWAREVVKKLELEKFCDPILISAEIGLAKPDPEIYAFTLRAVERSEAPEKCIFIDDKSANVTNAMAAGIKAIKYIGIKPLEEELLRFGVNL